MKNEEVVRISGDEVCLWIDQGVIMLKAVSGGVDPVELGEEDAGQLVDALNRFLKKIVDENL